MLIHSSIVFLVVWKNLKRQSFRKGGNDLVPSRHPPDLLPSFFSSLYFVKVGYFVVLVTSHQEY